MSSHILPTPILTGQDAINFEEAIKNPKPISKEEYEKAYNDYLLIKSIVQED